MLLLLSAANLFAATFAPLQPVRQTDSPVRVQTQRIVLRVSRIRSTRAALVRTSLPPIRWVERETAQCVPVTAFAAATVTQPNSVDLVLTGGRRVRAMLSNTCPAVDFYHGISLRTTGDGMVCAARDTFRSRSGGECRIQQFRGLVPAS